MRANSLLLALGLAGSAIARPFGETEAVLGQPLQSQEKADAVKEAFQHAWDGYMKYAFPHDELHPVSNGYGDSR
jgi:Glycosyl hydrolase family 47.